MRGLTRGVILLSGRRDDDDCVAVAYVGARGLEATEHSRYEPGHRGAGYCSSTLTSSKTAVATAAELWLVTTRTLADGDIARFTVPKVTHVTPSLDVWPV